MDYTYKNLHGVNCYTPRSSGRWCIHGYDEQSAKDYSKDKKQLCIKSSRNVSVYGAVMSRVTNITHQDKWQCEL